MHELAISQSLLDIIEAQRREHGFAAVRRVHVSLGDLSHVEPEALKFGFSVASRGTCAEGAAMDIEKRPATAWCTDCSQSVPLARRGDPCPLCSAWRLIVQSGDEMRLEALEVN